MGTEDILIGLASSFAGFLKATVKNSKSKAKVKNAVLAVYLAIKGVYSDDEDFQ